MNSSKRFHFSSQRILRYVINLDTRSSVETLFPITLFPGHNSSTHWTGGWLSPKATTNVSEHRKISCLYRNAKHGQHRPKLIAIPSRLSHLLCSGLSLFINKKIIFKQSYWIRSTEKFVGKCWSHDVRERHWPRQIKGVREAQLIPGPRDILFKKKQIYLKLLCCLNSQSFGIQFITPHEPVRTAIISTGSVKNTRHAITWILHCERSINIIFNECRNYNHGRQCTYNLILGRFRESLLPWKINKYYIFMRVFVRVRLCGGPGAWACVYACV